MLILFNKPFNVLCQFTDKSGRATLADFVDVPRVYPAGLLDYDSEGLVVLTDDGRLQTAWLELSIREGRNRQVRRMTAAVGLPTLRLVRVQVGDWSLRGLQSGAWKKVHV